MTKLLTAVNVPSLASGAANLQLLLAASAAYENLTVQLSNLGTSPATAVLTLNNGGVPVVGATFATPGYAPNPNQPPIGTSTALLLKLGSPLPGPFSGAPGLGGLVWIPGCGLYQATAVSLYGLPASAYVSLTPLWADPASPVGSPLPNPTTVTAAVNSYRVSPSAIALGLNGVNGADLVDVALPGLNPGYTLWISVTEPAGTGPDALANVQTLLWGQIAAPVKV